MGIKDQVKKNPEKYRMFMNIYNHFFGHNKIRIKGRSKLTVCSALLNHVNVYVEGNQNEIVIGSLTRMNGSSIFVKGNNNRIIIDDNNGFESCSLWIEDDGNEICIGAHNRFFKNSHLAAIEGTKITIGEDGLFAPDVQIRTGDSHSIMDMEGRRTNPSRNVMVGNHVWIGAGTVVLKGSKIPDETVIGVHSLVNKELDEKNCIYAGNPVKKIRTGVKWDSRRI